MGKSENSRTFGGRRENRTIYAKNCLMYLYEPQIFWIMIKEVELL